MQIGLSFVVTIYHSITDQPGFLYTKGTTQVMAYFLVDTPEQRDLTSPTSSNMKFFLIKQAFRLLIAKVF